MAENSKIEWCDHTFNPWVGCTKVSPACDHCYAESWAKRTGQSGLWAGERRRTSGTNWHQPIIWNRKAEAAGVRAKVFCASLADVFDNQVPQEWRDDMWHLISETPYLVWLLLTKRPQNIRKMLPGACVEQLAGRDLPAWPWPNVWLGTTVENQEEADRRIPHLLRVPATKRFLSCEPLLGPVDLRHGDDATEVGNIDWLAGYPGSDPPIPRIDWVICGGESGPKARPMHPDWTRTVRDQCSDAGVPFFFKQWGEHSLEFDRDRDDPDGQVCNRWSRKPGRWINISGGHGFHGDRVHYAHRVGKKRAGATLDGREWREMPQ